MTKAPIALFTYNRPDHTGKTIRALLNNSGSSESDLIIFSDAPKSHADIEKVSEVRQLIAGITGFRSVQVISRKENLGLAQSIITGVTDIVNKFGRVIVLEDDLVTSPFFLDYMNESLDLYEDEERVISIHGYNYPIEFSHSNHSETFFLRGADCWGWATWRRGWNLFEPDGEKLLNQLEERKLCFDFDYQGKYDFTLMLKHQIQNRVNSWAIRWYASAFLQNRLTLYPKRSLVMNIGNDSSGTHSESTDEYDVELRSDSGIRVNKIPMVEDVQAKAKVMQYFYATLIRNRNRLKWKKPNVHLTIKILLKELILYFMGKIRPYVWAWKKRFGYFYSLDSWTQALLYLHRTYRDRFWFRGRKGNTFVINVQPEAEASNGKALEAMKNCWEVFQKLEFPKKQRPPWIVCEFNGNFPLSSKEFKDESVLPLTTVDTYKKVLFQSSFNLEWDSQQVIYDIVRFPTILGKSDVIIAYFPWGLNYCSDPYCQLDWLHGNRFDYVILANLNVLDESHEHRISIFRNANDNGKTSYPVWFFDRKLLLQELEEFEIIYRDQVLPEVLLNNWYSHAVRENWILKRKIRD